MNKKAQTLQILQTSMFLILFLVVIIIVAIIATNSLSDTQDTTTSGTKASYFLQDNATTFTLLGTPSTLTAISKNSTWINLDGTNDKVYLSSIPLGNINGTVSLWINKSENQFGHIPLVATNGNKYVFYLNNVSNLSLSKWIIALHSQVVSNISIENNTWVHVGFVGNTSHIRFFKNGVRSYIVDPGLDGFNAATFSVGIGFNASKNDSFFNGSIDEVRIYDQAITEMEMQQIYNSGRERNSSLRTRNLTVWTSFNERGGTTIYMHNDTTTSMVKTGAVDGATWQHDDVNNSLVVNTDYTTSDNVFTLINDNYASDNITLSYTYSSATNEVDVIVQNSTQGFAQFFAQFPAGLKILGVVIVIMILAIIVTIIRRLGSSSPL